MSREREGNVAQGESREGKAGDRARQKSFQLKTSSITFPIQIHGHPAKGNAPKAGLTRSCVLEGLKKGFNIATFTRPRAGPAGILLKTPKEKLRKKEKRRGSSGV